MENLSSIEEQTILLKQQLENLEQKNESIELVKVLLSRAYENMKNSVSPVFTEKLSKNIANITKGKYCKLNFSDENGLIVELKNILLYLSEEFKNRQIIILTCTNREKEILNNENINYNYVEL